MIGLDIIAIQKERARRMAFENFINQQKQQNAPLIQILSGYVDALPDGVIKQLLVQSINAIEYKP